MTAYEPLVDGFLPKGAAGGRGAGMAATGRPADVLQLADGSILVTDDVGHRVIRVSYSRGSESHSLLTIDQRSPTFSKWK